MQEMFIVKHDIIRNIYTFLAIFYIYVYLQLVYTFFKIQILTSLLYFLNFHEVKYKTYVEGSVWRE